MSSTGSPLFLPSSSSSSSPSLLRFNQPTLPYSTSRNHAIRRSRRTPLATQLRVSSSDNYQTAVEVASALAPTSVKIDDASDVVRSFYEGINGRDLANVEELIADNCVYEDLIFPSPFVGRKAIMDFFKKFTDSISSDLQFVIDDISTEDSSAVGVTWHLDWRGKPFPFSKGCSFYRLELVNGKRQISYGRDSVEPAMKPGETALAAIGFVTWLLQQFPQLADRL